MADDRELTARAVALGLVLGFVLAAANVYAGLQIAYIDSGTTTIVLVAFAVRGIGARRLSAREANVVQVVGTSASAMAATAGLIGPVPALALAGRDISPIAIFIWACAVAVCGTFVALPLRERLLEAKRLAFPSARAAGELLRSLFIERGSATGRVTALAAAAAAAALVTALRDGIHVIPNGWMLPIAIAGIPAARLSIGIAASPLVAGVGVLAGVRTGIAMLIGGTIAWIAIAPVIAARTSGAPSYGTLVGWMLWPGAALMIGASLATIVLEIRGLVAAFRTGPLRMRSRLAIGALVAAAVVVATGWFGFGVHPGFALLGIGLATVFALPAMQATGETDTTPAGPLGGIGQIVVGAAGASDIAAPLFAGGTVNGVAAHAATMMNAWRTGSAVDATPAKLVTAQLAGIVAGAIAAVGAFWLLRGAYGLGSEAMPAPGAVSWKVTAEAVAGGIDAMPPGAGSAALIAVAAGAVLAALQRTRARRFVPSPIAMGIAFILPFSFAATLALASIAAAVTKRDGAALGAGLIIGEGIAGVVVAAIAVIG